MMNYGKKTNKIQRKQALSMEEVIRLFVNSLKIASGLNNQIIFNTWNEVSGAASFTLGQFFKKGTLYVQLNSSMVRSQLYFQRDVLVKKINESLKENKLFVKDHPNVTYVERIIFK